jgi:hypothetical protein
MDIFRKWLPLPCQVASQKTPWLVRLHPRLRGNVVGEHPLLGTADKFPIRQCYNEVRPDVLMAMNMDSM